jgi:hypothetical protein
MVHLKKFHPLFYLIAIFLAYLLINSYIIVRGNIYYTLNYEINLPEKQELIDRVETFNLSANLNHEEFQCRTKEFYFNREMLNSYMNSIKSDIGLHVNPFYSHTFEYQFEAQPINLSITYNNCSIIDSNYGGEHFLDPWGYRLYLNHSIIPTVSNSSNSIILDNVLLVKVSIIYSHSSEILFSGLGAEFVQYIALNLDLDIIFVNVPFVFTYP